MNAYTFSSFGIEHLQQTERERPEPGHGQIRVAIKAVSLNYRDLMMVRGQYNPRQPLPLIPCSDGVGVVDAVGPGVTQWQVGDRVIPLFAQSWMSGQLDVQGAKDTLGGPIDGTLTQAMVLPEHGAVRAPASMSDEEAATLPCAALTAWSALVTQGQLKAGQTVLIQGTGGVSLFALQIAKMMGARVIMTSSSDEKLARVSKMGADELINYKTHPKWGKVAKSLTDGLGVDHVIEVGGAGTLEQSIKAVRLDGHISLIGVLSGVSEPLNIIPILMRNIRVQGIFVGHKQSMTQMCAAFEQNHIKPVIDHTFAFDEAPAAFEHLASGKHMGKICIRISQ